MGYRTYLKTLLVQGSGRKVNQTDRIRWHDLKSAFQNRIRTGCIANLQHLDPQAFLEDAKIMFVPRIKNELKKEPFLKVNTVFSGKFKLLEREEFKYFHIKNQMMDADTDLNVWYNEFVKDVILRELEEFQVSYKCYLKHEIISNTSISRNVIVVGLYLLS